MAWQIVVTKNAAKDVKKMSPPVQKRIRQKLVFFRAQADPLVFAKTLTNSRDGMYRWRIGDYRLVFDIDGHTIVLLRVQHRRDVYRV